MRLDVYHNYGTLEKIFKLVISYEDMQSLRLHRFETALIDECSMSDKPSDNLLALEMIVRKLEQQHPQQIKENTP